MWGHFCGQATVLLADMVVAQTACLLAMETPAVAVKVRHPPSEALRGRLLHAMATTSHEQQQALAWYHCFSRAGPTRLKSEV